MTPRMLLEATLGGGRLLKRKSSVLMVAACGAAGLYGAISAFAAPPSKTAVDAENARYAETMLDEGRKTFRYETFGSEAFWGDALQLHKAIAGEKHGGVKPANFLDIGGGASAEVMAAGLDVILNDAQVKSVFVNVFGGITACDAVATGIVQALQILGDEANKPLVVRLDGNNVDEGRRILAEANHPLVTVVPTMDEAADKAAALASA